MNSKTEQHTFGLAEGINTAVIAGAGTGKTTRLIGEIIALIERRDVPIERILAVTFSEAAAADMKEKLNDRLRARFEETGDQRYLKAVSGLSRAQVSTVHALGRRILAENPFEAGIDPQFTIQEESSDVLLYDEIWRQWAKGVFWGGTPLDDDLILLLKYMSAEGLKRMALTLAARPDRLEEYEANRVDPRQETLRIERQLGQLSATLGEIDPSADEEDLLYKRFCRVKEIVAGPALASIPEALGHSPISRRGGSPKKWRDREQFDEVKRLIDGPGGAIDTLREARGFPARRQQDEVVRTAIRVLSDFVGFFRAEKRRRGILSFFDLIWETKLLLERDRTIRRRYQNEFDYILVDEFQDIDPILGDIVMLLAEDGPVCRKPSDVRLKPGKLFIVGDPKQSIYRFREADIGVFFAVMKKIEESGGRVDRLGTNYRSQRHLIAFQNAFFDRYIYHEDDHYTIRYDALTPVLSDVAAADRPPAVRIVDSNAGLLSAEEVRRAEADYIAGQILNLVEKKTEGGIVRDSRTGRAGYRDVEYRDIAVLFRWLAGVSLLYEEALKRAGIPYFIVGGRGYFQRQEIYDVTNILRAVLDPTDRRSLIGALRSPAFGIDDLALYEAARAQGLSYAAGRYEGPVAEALDTLRRLHDSAFRLTVSGLLAEIYRAVPIVEVNAFGPGGAQRVGNLMKIQETARALEFEGPVTLPAFLKLLTALSVEREDESEAAVTEEGKNAVRIMTIHAAKGLEFPVVFVCDLGKKKRPWDREGIFIDRADRPVAGARLGSAADFGYASVIRDREECRTAAEERRLLYVAATRARDRLFLVGSGKEATSHQSALLEFVNSQGGDPPAAVAEPMGQPDGGKFTFEKRRATLGALFYGPSDPAPLLGARATEDERRAQCGRAVAERVFSFVTSQKHEEPAEASAPIASDTEGIGRLVGTLVHEVLAEVDFSQTRLSEGLIEHMAANIGIPPERAPAVIAESRRLVESVLDSEMASEIRSARIIGRELPLLTQKDAVTLTGRIDIVYETADGIVVLDYKTDNVTPEGAAEAALGYTGQIRAYVETLTNALTADTLITGGVYFIRPGVFIQL